MDFPVIFVKDPKFPSKKLEVFIESEGFSDDLPQSTLEEARKFFNQWSVEPAELEPRLSISGVLMGSRRVVEISAVDEDYSKQPIGMVSVAPTYRGERTIRFYELDNHSGMMEFRGDDVTYRVRLR